MMHLQTQKKRKGRVKGVQYVDEDNDVADLSLLPDQHGHPTWRIEDRNNTQSDKYYSITRGGGVEVIHM